MYAEICDLRTIRMKRSVSLEEYTRRLMCLWKNAYTKSFFKLFVSMHIQKYVSLGGNVYHVFSPIRLKRYVYSDESMWTVICVSRLSLWISS